MGDFFMDRLLGTGNKRKYVSIGLVIFSVYFFMKFLSPIVSPFLVAFLIAGALCKLTNKIPVKIRKSFLASILLFVFVSIFAILVWSVGSWIIEKCSDFAGNMHSYEADLCRFLTDCCDRMENRFGVDGTAIEDFVLEQINIFADNLEVNVFPAVMNKSVGYMKTIAGLVSFVVVTVIAVFLMLKDYEKVAESIKKNEDFKGVLEIAGKVIHYIKTYVKAQATILLIISGGCVLVLSLVGIEGSFLYGILTGFMDMLPFIGTGLMLMPVAFFQLIAGKYWQAVVIVILYGVCVLIREFLEPKLIGNKVGIWPVGILFAVFAGVQLFGISGIIKGPIGLVIIWETCRYLFCEKKEKPEGEY